MRLCRPCHSLNAWPRVYRDRLAVGHGELRRSWREVYDRCRRLASAAGPHGIGKGDTAAHCKQHLAGFKVSRAVVFGEIPKTATGKIQKFELRKQAGSAAAIDV